MTHTWKLILLSAALAAATPCAAEGLHLAHDDWTGADTARQAAFTVLLAVDWRQTRDIAHRPQEVYETNPLLGRHPAVGQVDAYFALAALGHAAVSYALPRGWREGWQYVWIGVEADKTYHNYVIGLRVNLP